MDVKIESPFPLEAVPRIWSWVQTFRNRVMDDYSPATMPEFVQKTAEQLSQVKSWAVYRDGELGGMVTFQEWSPMLGTCHCIFKKELWGHKTTVPALEAIAQEIFDSGITKISMCVFADNKAIQTLLRKLGAVEEGVYRRHTMRDGIPVDMTAYALFKEGFDARSNSSSVHRV